MMLTATEKITIFEGESESTTLTTKGYSNIGIIVPRFFESTSITFRVSADNESFFALFDENGEVTLAVEDQAAYALPAAVMNFHYVLLTSNATETADREIVVTKRGS